MGFSQLYYTSCERGLSGHPGYQFNAATPGVRPDVMAEVESMTAYDPPRSLTYGADPAAIAAAPVNLCYRPGATTVLAQVAFVGTDYSRRFGNYFAHALVTENAQADFGEVLPIELWGSRLWARQPVDDPALPVLGGLAPGALDRSGVAAFVSRHPGARHLPALLTAIDLAVRRQDRKVVVVEGDAGSVAGWIAAASYLLPPESARHMSFATYEHEPRYSRMHVVGTLAESEVDRTAFETYHLFDFVADEISPIQVHPLAEFLVDMGVDSAQELWRRAGALSDGTEHGLDEWHPVVLADNGADQVGSVVVAPWLAGHAQRLGARTVDRVGALLDLDGCQVDVLARLAQASGDVGAVRFAEDVELAWARKFIESAPSGAPMPVRSASAREYMSAALAERLPRVDARAAVALLDWARTSGIEVRGDVQYQTGLRAIGPAVFDDGASEWLAPLLGSWPELRGGVVAHVSSSVHSRLSDVVGLISSELAPVLRLREAPGLATAALVADATAGRIPPARALARVADSGFVPVEVLTLLWPQGWTHHDALQLLDNVEKRLFCEPPLLEWLDRALLAPGTDDYDRLCAKVREEPVLEVLPRETVKRINTRFQAASLVDRMVQAWSEPQFGQAMNDFLGAYRGTRSPERRAELMSVLIGKSGEMRMDWFALLYSRLQDVRDAYLASTEPALHSKQANPAVAADLLTLSWHLKDVVGVRGINAMNIEVIEHTLPAVRKWRRPLVRQVIEVLERRGPRELLAWFVGESRAYAGNAVARFMLGQLRQKGRSR